MRNIPLVLLAMAVLVAVSGRAWQAVCASPLILHNLCNFPLHLPKNCVLIILLWKNDTCDEQGKYRHSPLFRENGLWLRAVQRDLTRSSPASTGAEPKQ